MSRYAGMAVAAMMTGIVLPVMIVGAIATTITNKEPVIQITEAQVEILPSPVETFIVDYEQYGNMFVGETFIRCTITNNSGNLRNCVVYLKDGQDNRITEPSTLHPSGRESVMSTTWSEDTPGKYDVTLVYEVDVDGKLSTIECPFIILLNGGG